jgi:hypothetical protein
MMATHELVVPKSMPMILPMFFSGKSKKCLNESEVGAVWAISSPKWLNLRLFCPELPQKRRLTTSVRVYLGAVTVTNAGRNTRSAMR